MRYLVVDDHARVRAVLKAMLCGPADMWHECADGAHAAAAFREFQPDWTLMDISMPHVDGITATREIVAAHPEARVVVLTQYDSPDYEEAARAAGACAFMSKENLQPLLTLLATPPYP